MRGLEFMKPLVDDMVQDDPEKRPTMAVVVERFEKILGGLSWWTLASRLVEIEGSATSPFASVRHLFRTLGNTLSFRSPLPTLK